MTKSFDDYFQEKMKDPVIKQEYDALEPEYAIISALVEAREDQADRALAILKKEMEHAYETSVPLDVEIKAGRTWYDAH